MCPIAVGILVRKELQKIFLIALLTVVSVKWGSYQLRY